MSSEKKYIYLEVLPRNYSSTYSFFGTEEIAVGDYVLAPFRDKEKVGLVLDVRLCDDSDAPYPPEHTKSIIRKVGENEPETIKKQIQKLVPERAKRIKTKSRLEKEFVQKALDDYGVDQEKLSTSRDRMLKLVDDIPEQTKTLQEVQNEIKGGMHVSEDKKTLIRFEPTKEFEGVVKIPYGVEAVDDHAFDYWTKTKELFLPKELKKIGKYTIFKMDESRIEYEEEYPARNISSIRVEEGNEVYSVDDNALYSLANGGRELVYVFHQELEEFIVPSDVVKIGKGAFANCGRLAHLVLPENLESFDERALMQDTEVREIVLPKRMKHLTLRSVSGRSYEQIRYVIDEDSEYLFADEDSIYEVLEDGTYKLVMNRYNGKGKPLILENTSVIGRRAFADHENLVSIELPDSVRVIEIYAFLDCENLKKVRIPSGVEEIDADAFFRCDELKQKNLYKKAKKGKKKKPDAEKPVTKEAVSANSDVGKNPFTYSVKDDKIYLEKWNGNPQTKKIVIPASIDGKPVYSMGEELFGEEIFLLAPYGTQFPEELVISEGVKRVEDRALCHHVFKTIKFPRSVEYIGKDVFSYDFVFQGEITRDQGLDEDQLFVAPAGSYAEKFLKGYKPKRGRITTLKVVNDDSAESKQEISILSALRLFDVEDGIRASLFQSDLSKGFQEKDITLPSVISGKPLVSFNLADFPDFVETLVIPEYVRELFNIDDEGLFKYQEKRLHTIRIAEENQFFWSDGKAIFSKDRKILYRFMAYPDEQYEVPDGTEVIGKNAFWGMKNLARLVIPSSVHTIGVQAFGECEQLADVEGLEHVANLEEEAFSAKGIYGLIPYLAKKDIVIIGKTLVRYNDLTEKVIRVPDGITRIYNDAFSYENENDNVEEIILPDTVRSIDKGAFSERKKLQRIHISASVQKIDARAFPMCWESAYDNGKDPVALSRICVSDENESYESVNGMLISKRESELLVIPGNMQESRIVIPDGIKAIHTRAAIFHPHLKELIVPDSVRTIGEEAFYGCRNLNQVVLSDGIEEIETRAFCTCKQLKQIRWSDSLKVIGERAFAKTGISEVTLPEGVEVLGEEAFAGYHRKKVTLPKSVRTLGWGVFSGTEEIEVYDTIDPDAKECGEAIDTSNGNPNSLVGYIGMGPARAMWQCAANHKWIDHIITVKSAETDKIKYKVWMGADDSQREYYCLLSSAWGKNATFDFPSLDEFFKRIRGAKHKQKVAEYRLKYPVDLSDEYREKYKKYLKRS